MWVLVHAPLTGGVWSSLEWVVPPGGGREVCGRRSSASVIGACPVRAYRAPARVSLGLRAAALYAYSGLIDPPRASRLSERAGVGRVGAVSKGRVCKATAAPLVLSGAGRGRIVRHPARQDDEGRPPAMPTDWVMRMRCGGAGRWLARRPPRRTPQTPSLPAAFRASIRCIPNSAAGVSKSHARSRAQAFKAKMEGLASSGISKTAVPKPLGRPSAPMSRADDVARDAEEVLEVLPARLVGELRGGAPASERGRRVPFGNHAPGGCGKKPGESVSSYPPLPPSSVSSYPPLPPSTASSEQYPPLPASTISASSSSVSEISSLSFSTNSTSLPHLEPPTPYESSEESSDVATPMSLAFSSVSSVLVSGPSPIESRAAPLTLYEAPSELSRTMSETSLTSSSNLTPLSRALSSLRSWGRASSGTYESSILGASPSVGSIALHDAPDTSGETSFLRPTESISSFDRLSTIPGSIPSTVTPPLPSSLSDVSTPLSLGFPSDSSSSLGRTLSVLSQSSFMSDSSSVHSSVFDGSLPESEPLEEPATTSLLSTPRPSRPPSSAPSTRSLRPLRHTSHRAYTPSSARAAPISQQDEDTASPLRVPRRLCRAPRSYLPLTSAVRHRPAETYPAVHVRTPQLPAPHPAKVDSPPPPPTVELSPRSSCKKSSSLLAPSALLPRTPSAPAALEDEVHPGSRARDAALEHRARAAVFAAYRATPLRMPPLRLERLPHFPRCLHYHGSAPPVLDVRILLAPHPVHVAFRVDVLETHRTSPSHALATSSREPCALRSHPASPSPAHFASRAAPPPLKPTPAHISPPPALASPTPAHVPWCSTSPTFRPAPVLEASPPRALARLHLYAPPALAARILPRLTCAAPPSSPPATSLAPGRPASDNANALNTNGAHKGLSAAALVRLAPDPHAKRGWHRVRSHNAEVEALAGRILAAERAGRGRVRLVPVLSLSDAEAEGEVVKAGVVKERKTTARAVGVRVRVGMGGGGGGGRAALRVLRIAVAREAGAGGGRVWRAVLARASRSGDRGEEEGEGLALHVLFGARVERRTIEKVLHTLGARSARGYHGWDADNKGTVRAAELYKFMHAVLPRFPALHTLLLTRPPALYPPRPAELPSPRSSSFFFLSPPATPGFPPPPAVPHARVPGQAPLSLRVPPPPPFRGPPSEDVTAWLRWAVSPRVALTLILTLPVPLALRLSVHWSRSQRP
ncbi:hypothetical protein DFH09DRAFT_1495308 [Mycena vulgaris]|nr:hypothetical protein DFH09DRAFT_1495308 [Mycena vulgaris]